MANDTGREAMRGLLDQVDWQPLPEAENPAELHATHAGVLNIPGLGSLKVYQLSDGRRVFDAADVEARFNEGR